MTTAKKLAANRANAQKGRGPKTPGGKRRSCRNSLRHGLAAINHSHPTYFDQIEQIAKALCGNDQNPDLFTQAIVIAENDWVLRVIARECVGIIERFRDPFATPLANQRASMAMLKVRCEHIKIAHMEYLHLREKLDKEAKADAFDEPPPKYDPWAPVAKYRPLKVRDEYEAMEIAQSDLKRLSRYERRAWSRRKRALQVFTAIKLLGPKF